MFDEITGFCRRHSGKEHVFLTGSGTTAVYLALKSSGLPSGAKIAVSNLSCPDPVFALIWAGYRPVFIDVNLEDYNIDVDRLEEEVGRDDAIKGVIAVHLFGNACGISRIREICTRRELFLVEDCAQALGGVTEDGTLGSFGDVSIFSFGNGKILECGHGGSLQSDDAFVIKRACDEYAKLNDYDPERAKRLAALHRSLYYKLYNISLKHPLAEIGSYLYVLFFRRYYLHKLDPSCLPVILQATRDFAKNLNDRSRIVEYYRQKIASRRVILPKCNNKIPAFSRFTVRVDQAEQLSQEIRDAGIHSNTMYPMLIGKFSLRYDRSKYKNSLALKGKLLNLWTNALPMEKIHQTVQIVNSKD